MKLYFVLRAQRGYDYVETVDRSKLRDDYNNNKEVHNEFYNYWNNLFKKSYNQVRKELKALVLETVHDANFDKVYLNLDDFRDDYGNILADTDPEEKFVLFMDDDDFIKPNVCDVLRKNYIPGFDGITWNYLRYHGLYNCFYSPNTMEYTVRGIETEANKLFLKNDLRYSPWPYIQSNHCVIKLPSVKKPSHGSWWSEYQQLVPVNHSCIHLHLFEHNSNRKIYNIAQCLSLHNTTPASYSFYDNDYKTGGRHKEIFDDPQNFYNRMKSFVEDEPHGTTQYVDDEFKVLLDKQRKIFEGCL